MLNFFFEQFGKNYRIWKNFKKVCKFNLISFSKIGNEFFYGVEYYHKLLYSQLYLKLLNFFDYLSSKKLFFFKKKIKQYYFYYTKHPTHS